MFDDERGVSITVGYVLNFAIATALFSGLLVAGTGMIDTQTQSVTNDELAVTGQQLASDLSDADRLVRAGTETNPTALSLQSDLPERTAAGGYTIAINYSGSRGTIELQSNSPEVTVAVSFRSRTDVANTTLGSGTVRIEYDRDSSQLVVTSA